MTNPLTPEQIPAAYANGVRMMEAGQLREAFDVFSAITRLRPEAAEAHWQIGRIAGKIGDTRAAVQALETAQRLKPNELVVLTDYAVSLKNFGDRERQVEVLRRILEMKPDFFQARSELAIALQELGEFEAAEVELRRCMEAEPKNGVLWRLLVTGRKMKAGDPAFEAMHALKEDAFLVPRHKGNLDFALAKAYDDIGEPEKAFTYLVAANDEIGRLHPYKQDERDAEIAGLKAAFEGVDLSRRVPGANPDFAPVFVTGVPRSGTTLAEQIVGAHSAATAVGEATELRQSIGQFLGHDTFAIRPLSGVSDDQLAAIGRRYEELLRRRFQFGRVSVDKSVQTWHFIGLIKMVLPNARVIVMRRDPRDNLLSIYKNHFSEGAHKYAYSFEDMVHYLKSFHEMLDFWRERAPGSFTEVSYDALVADPEPRARELIAAAGLEWEDQCLEFYKQKNRVATLSIAQVRQPIYTSSSRSWEKYGDGLKPLLDALEREGLLPDDA